MKTRERAPPCSLREQQPDLGAGNEEVHEALLALKAESEATEAAAAAAPPAAAAPSAAGEGVMPRTDHSFFEGS